MERKTDAEDITKGKTQLHLRMNHPHLSEAMDALHCLHS
jgi:hypothetical protein